MFKSERREKQREKKRRGMQVTNTSIRTLARLQGSHPTARAILDEPEWCLHCGSETCQHVARHNAAYGGAE